MDKKTLQKKRDELSKKRYGKPYAWLCSGRRRAIDAVVMLASH